MERVIEGTSQRFGSRDRTDKIVYNNIIDPDESLVFVSRELAAAVVTRGIVITIIIISWVLIIVVVIIITNG